MPALSIEFFEDDDDIKYVEAEGKMEVKFPLEEMDAFAAGLRGKSGREIAQGVAGLAMEVALAYVEELFEPLQDALVEHYSITPPDDSVRQEYSGLLSEMMPGFFEAMTKEDFEE